MNYLLLYISNNSKKQLLLLVYVPFFTYAHTVQYTRKLCCIVVKHISKQNYNSQKYNVIFVAMF
jgi:hypothetical protein